MIFNLQLLEATTATTCDLRVVDKRVALYLTVTHSTCSSSSANGTTSLQIEKDYLQYLFF